MKISINNKTFIVIGTEEDNLRILHPDNGGPVLVHSSKVKIIDKSYPKFWKQAHRNGKVYSYPEEFLTPNYFRNLWEVKGLLEIDNFYSVLEKFYPELDISNRKWITS